MLYSFTPLEIAVIPRSANVITVPALPKNLAAFGKYLRPFPNNPDASSPPFIYLLNFANPVSLTPSNPFFTIASTGFAISEIFSKIVCIVFPLFPNDSYQAIASITPLTNFLPFVPLSTESNNPIIPSDCRKAFVNFSGVKPSICAPLLNQSLSSRSCIFLYNFFISFSELPRAATLVFLNTNCATALVIVSGSSLPYLF